MTAKRGRSSLSQGEPPTPQPGFASQHEAVSPETVHIQTTKMEAAVLKFDVSADDGTQALSALLCQVCLVPLHTPLSFLWALCTHCSNTVAPVEAPRRPQQTVRPLETEVIPDSSLQPMVPAQTLVHVQAPLFWYTLC